VNVVNHDRLRAPQTLGTESVRKKLFTKTPKTPPKHNVKHRLQRSAPGASNPTWQFQKQTLWLSNPNKVFRKCWVRHIQQPVE
jgi:hypothetical protein